MASRRLDISSLLCDDNPPNNVKSPPPRPPPVLVPNPVVLAPHLRRFDPVHDSQRSLPPSYPPPFLGLDALVHAATEERRRLEQPLDRQRQHHEQLLLQERQHQLRAQERLYSHVQPFDPPPPPPPLPQPRKSDPGLFYPPPPSKKRRHSDSPSHTLDTLPPLGVGPPRRPGSGQAKKSHVIEPPVVAIERPPEVVIPPIRRPPSRQARPLLSPHGRRSPPGSAIGRAKAARKPEDPPKPRLEPEKPVQEDPHEWFLRQTAQHKSPTPPPVPSPKQAVPDAVAALEEELDAITTKHEPSDPPMMDVDTNIKPSPDDVDQAVAELVAETLGTDEHVKREEVGMGMEVEDELLRLVDDKPPPPPAPPTSPPFRMVVESVPRSPSPPAASPPPSTLPASSALSDRASMPPPTSTVVNTAKKEDKEKPGVLGTTKKKKEAKPAPKPKVALPVAAPKPRTKPGTKKPRQADAPPTAPGKPAKDTKAEEEEQVAADEDKLYCVCKTRYDEDRFMIACDRCDEWYHTQCVHMPDSEVDLVDQFICPICIDTVSVRVEARGPIVAPACHRPARGAFSKYCSEECGVKYMHSRIEAWEKKGGDRSRLWDKVKGAEKREGVVKSKTAREIERLKVLLEQVVVLREEIKKGMEVVLWRERLLELASERAEHLGSCGWDQRLCFGDEEWVDFGTDVLDSYEDVKASGDEMEVDGEGEWWCPGNKQCDRHTGWQSVRYKDICKEKEKKEEALAKLTTREREIRKRIEDLADPQSRACNENTTTPSKTPLSAASNVKHANGHAKARTNGDVIKKGKKRKAPAQ
ncbi:hypothetical protein BD779DRAFT_1464807 [Infundibulicybe gibba]|nr:hypothetical protein BD779DRAFT_1464807 [Infundibulicybe gibba]